MSSQTTDNGYVWFRGKMPVALIIAAVAAIGGGTWYSTGSQLGEVTKALRTEDKALDTKINLTDTKVTRVETRMDEHEKFSAAQWDALQKQLDRRFGSIDTQLHDVAQGIQKIQDFHMKEAQEKK